MRILYMGTPDFAIAPLQALLKANYEVVGVVTAPDRRAGRGMKLRPSPVKQYAQAHGLKVLQPIKLKDPEFLKELEALKPDLAVVVAFRMLPRAVWSLPTHGTFNLHASLLPDYRGAAPINWAVINGETQSGVTTFFIDQQIDTGNILLQQKVDIFPHWTAGDLHDTLMVVGADLVVKTVEGLEKGELVAQPQDDSLALHPAPKIFKDDCRIDWQQPAKKIYDFIRGLSPYPTAWSTLNGQSLKVFRAQQVELLDAPSPGQLLQDEEGRLLVSGSDGWLEITELQLAGKKRMSSQAFLSGFKEKLERLE
jgi:methionyl-tRNA formyltransferase